MTYEDEDDKSDRMLITGGGRAQQRRKSRKDGEGEGERSIRGTEIVNIDDDLLFLFLTLIARESLELLLLFELLLSLTGGHVG